MDVRALSNFDCVGDPNNLVLNNADYNTMIFSYGAGLEFGYHANRGGVQLKLASGCSALAATTSQTSACVFALP